MTTKQKETYTQKFIKFLGKDAISSKRKGWHKMLNIAEIKKDFRRRVEHLRNVDELRQIEIEMKNFFTNSEMFFCLLEKRRILYGRAKTLSGFKKGNKSGKNKPNRAETIPPP